jgi:hypothetical protein
MMHCYMGQASCSADSNTGSCCSLCVPADNTPHRCALPAQHGKAHLDSNGSHPQPHFTKHTPTSTPALAAQDTRPVLITWRTHVAALDHAALLCELAASVPCHYHCP